MPAKLLMILTENQTLVPPDDLTGLVDLAVIAEQQGFDAVMLSEHVVLGPTANALGQPSNPREYAAPGNQDPAMSWPSSLVLASGIAAVTTRIRIVLGALIFPLRHPVNLAKELATLDCLAKGRLVVQPTVSWHRDEYAALGVPFSRRGRILDEQLDAMSRLWGETPASYSGEYFQFRDVYCEPKPFRRSGRPVMWFGGQSLHEPLLRRLIRYGDGFHPFGAPSNADLKTLAEALSLAGRDIDDLEMVGGTRASFASPNAVADIAAAMESFAAQRALGVSTFCMKPSQHTDDIGEVAGICKRMVEHVRQLP